MSKAERERLKELCEDCRNPHVDSQLASKVPDLLRALDAADARRLIMNKVFLTGVVILIIVPYVTFTWLIFELFKVGHIMGGILLGMAMMGVSLLIAGHLLNLRKH
jgi:hypothetical protein